VGPDDGAPTAELAAEAPGARHSRLTWPAILIGLFVAAFVLRIVGYKTGLPYVYNADENSHFVPRAIGMFGHSPNPGYFINPPAFTYVVAALFAVRWGTDPATIGGAFAADPTTAFALARAASAFLGALAVSLTAIAGARLFDDRRVGVLAGALLAVAFLPTHYSHFALNDAPTLAPLAAALIGVAGIYRTGRIREYVLAGLGLGVAIATKYTAGIVLVTVIAAAFASPVAHARGRNLALAIGLMCAGFVAANPYALLDHTAFRDGLRKQTETAGEDGGKLGLANSSGWTYYLTTFTWGLGWLPSLFALGGIAGLFARHRRLALLLAPAPILLFLYLGQQSRFFARWLLPIYPILCLLAAWAVIAAATWLATRFKWRLAIPALALSVLVVAQGLVFSVHNDLVLAKADTRQVARDWMKQHIPAATNIVVEPLVLLQRQDDHQRFVPRGQDRGLRAHHAPRAGPEVRGRRLLLGRDRLDPVRAGLRGPEGRPVRAQVLRRAQGQGQSGLPDEPVREGQPERALLVRLLVQLLPVDL
jgi:hypothetical protein